MNDTFIDKLLYGNVMREVCMSTGWWSEILYWLAFRRIASVGVFPTATAKSVMQSHDRHDKSVRKYVVQNPNVQPAFPE